MFSHSLKFQLQMQVLFTKLSPEKPKIWTSLLPFWKVLSGRAAFFHVIPSKRFCLNGFWRAFHYYTELWLLLSHIILSQTCSKLQNDSVEDSEVDNSLGKIDFVDFVKNAKSVVGFSPLPVLSQTEWRHKYTAWLPLDSFKWRPLKWQISSGYQALQRLKLIGEWKSRMFTCYRQRQKKNTFWKNPLF